jgi:HlyD family secretion protein
MRKIPSFLPLILILVLGGGAIWFLNARSASSIASDGAYSGVIEAYQVNVSPEVAGRVLSVSAQEGESVQAGRELVRLDSAVLDAQREQAAAALKAAQAAAKAAASNLELVQAGPSDQQLAAAQAAVDQAQVALDSAKDAYDTLSATLKDTPDGKKALYQQNQAEAAVKNAQAQYDLLKAGPRQQQVDAAQAQADAAAAQAQAAEAALKTVEEQVKRFTLSAPVSGVVLSRSIEPGEYAVPGASLLVIGRLDALTLTVYIPEDRYGQIQLDQTVPVQVDSFPGQTFQGKVTAIADQAEFTPRNVQTTASRKSTVFAIKIALQDPDGKLKPGMPADVQFK